jgi:hypothetical protein
MTLSLSLSAVLGSQLLPSPRLFVSSCVSRPPSKFEAKERMADITASVPITWEQAAAWIAEGTVESLGRLRRSEAQLGAYRAAMDKVLDCHRSLVVVGAIDGGGWRHQ